MASSEPGTSIIGAGTDHDIFSHLPAEIKDIILTKLPIKDAVRTSLLSNKWRYTWASMLQIVVKDDAIIPTIDLSEPSLHFVRNVDLLLSNHKGPILKFYLSTKYICPEAFDRWILNLSANGITDISFLVAIASISEYRIPSNFFFCDRLQHIHLSACLIEVPNGFEGFKLLRTLQLEKCTISASDLGWLVSKSPHLVNLLLLMSSQMQGDIKIVSTQLMLLGIGGDFSLFSDLQIDAPKLTSLLIGCYNYKSSPARVKCMNKFWHSLGSLRNIRYLAFVCSSLSELVDRAPVVLLSSCLKKMSNLTLGVDPSDHKESGCAFSLLQNATKLQHLCLFVKRSESSTSSRSWDKCIVFKSLRIVLIRRFIASEPVLAFVKFILGSAPNLRNLTLREDPKGPEERNPETLERVLKFQRASTRAEIIFE